MTSQTSFHGDAMRKNRMKAKDTNFWQIQEAKAKFSQLVDDANKKGVQTITKNGEPIAVMISKKEFDKMIHKKESLLCFFKAAPCQEIDIEVPRSGDLSRDIDL
jgi:antitoxin Phd